MQAEAAALLLITLCVHIALPLLAEKLLCCIYSSCRLQQLVSSASVAVANYKGSCSRVPAQLSQRDI